MNIGIDLGTTNTLACYVSEAGTVEKIEFLNGRTDNKFLLPSCIAVMSDGSIKVGQPAVDMKQKIPECVLENTKYYMGTGKTWSVGRITVSAEQTAEYILREVHDELSRQFPQEESFRAFVTVPARFDSQSPRIATKEALLRAGFTADNADCVTDEPIAAAVAYSKLLDGGQTILVVDFGGGTFDISLLHSKIVGASVSPDRLIPVSWGGDLYIGGNTADKIITELMCKKILEEKGCDLSANPDSMRYSAEESEAAAVIRTYTETIKKQLYAENSDGAEVYIPELISDYDFDFSLSCAEYENAFGEVSQKMRDIIQGVFKNAGMAVNSADKVLVVGGMAHEYCLVKMLKSMFGEEKIIIPDDSMYLVARGASICGSDTSVHVDNVAYTSIGVLIKERTDVDVIIREGEVIERGFEVEREYTPSKDNAWELNIAVAEFRGAFRKDGYTTLIDTVIPLKKRLLKRKQKLKFRFVFTEDKILQITVKQPDGTESPLSVRL